MATTYLQSDFTGTGSASGAKATYSVWVKAAVKDDRSTIISGRADANNYMKFRFANDSLTFYGNHSSSNNLNIETNRKFRDPSSWYHIVLQVDTTSATETDRVKIFVNGVQETSLANSTYPAQGAPLYLTKEDDVQVGAFNNTEHFDGCMSYFYCIDGTIYAPTVFGETDSTDGMWKIVTDPTVTYGSKGWLIFKNGANLSGSTVSDQSTNSNDWTVATGTITETEDCADNNFSTLSPLTVDTGGAKTYANGNTTATETANSWTSTHSTLMASTGKYYCETKLVSFSGGSASYIGASSAYSIQSKANAGSILGTDTGSVGYYATNGNVDKAGASTAYGASWGAGNIIGTAIDLDNNFIYFSKDGVWQNSGDPTSGATGTGGVALPSGMTGGEFIGFSISPHESVMAVNYGNGYFQTTVITSAGTNASNNGIFEYDVPAGFTALCTKGINT